MGVASEVGRSGSTAPGKPWLRELVDFALDQDVSEEIARQKQRLEVLPDSAELHLNLGVLYYSQGDIEAALGQFFAAIICDPEFAPAYSRLGELYVRLGDYAEAHQYAVMAAERGDRRLLEAFERHPEPQLGLARKKDSQLLSPLETGD